MTELLQISPRGHLLANRLIDSPIGDTDPGFRRLISAFNRSGEEGLFTLGARAPATADSSLAFFRDFAERYLHALCRLGSDITSVPEIDPPDRRTLASMLLAAPPMVGAEYLNIDVLEALWRTLDRWVRDTFEASGLEWSAWLHRTAPGWHHVGRVCLHLAENRNDEDYPFAFMATYAPRLTQSGRVQFQPLARALKEYAGAGNRNQLVQLLEPIHEASRQVPLVAELVESGDIYHPLAWTAREAHSFLTAIPRLEECGLLTRLPDWWKSRPRPRVNVTVGGTDAANRLGADTLLQFRAEVALGDDTLDAEQIRALLQGDEPLIRLNGQWVEVDRDRLEQALEHWKLVETDVAHGEMTFAEGMRLLAGTHRDLRPQSDEVDRDIPREWTSIRAGAWLTDTLERLRNPQATGTSDQPGGLIGELRPYQHDGFRWLRLLTALGIGGCLADDMGLGKTIQVIALLLSLKERFGAPAPSLLVLPASLLGNWKSEFERFAPSLRSKFAHPSESDKSTLDRLAADPASSLAGVDVVVTTYGMLTRQTWLRQWDWNLVIIDEAQAIKNPGTRQTRAVKSLKGQTRIALTGTPIENRLGDLWSIFDFTCPGLLGNANTFQRFARSLQQDSAAGYAPLRRLVSPYILRRLKTDKHIISDLPDKTEVKAYCALAPRQAALYQRTVDELGKRLNGLDGIERRGLVLAYLMRFKQICNHPSQALGDNDYQPRGSGKFERLGTLCEEIAARQDKVLVFTQFREMIEPLERYLTGIFGQSGLALHGGTPVARRRSLVDAFQKENGPPFFILSLKAGGSGLNLTAASHVIHFDRWWNPAVENQATDRAFRIGQHRNVLVHKFVCRGTVEEKVDALIDDKRSLSENLLEGGEETRLTELADDELLALVALDIHGAA